MYESFLDRDLVPGVSHFAPQDSPAIHGGNIIEGLTQEDLATIYRKGHSQLQLRSIPSFPLLVELGSLPVNTILHEVKRLHDIAYELGIEERKETTRGKYLNIFKTNRLR
jgi:hypothetical protein